MLPSLVVAVSAALAEEHPSDGMRHLKPFLCEGFRSDIADLLLSKMPDMDWDQRANTLQIFYYLFGTSGYAASEDTRDLRPENAKPNEPMTMDQIERFLTFWDNELDPVLWESYASVLALALEHVTTPYEMKLRIEKLCRRSLTAASNMSARAQMLLKELDCM